MTMQAQTRIDGSCEVDTEKSGYYDGDAVKKWLAEGVIPYIPKPNTSANRKLGLFGKGDFA